MSARRLARLAIAAWSVLAMPAGAQAARLWHWTYKAGGIEAAGTFTTEDQPDAEGFYRIIAITGKRNGVRIAALTPAGEAIPGNAPYQVDNRIALRPPQLTKAGFGYKLRDRQYANAFFGGSGYVEYLSKPPYRQGAGPEGAIAFTASPERK